MKSIFTIIIILSITFLSIQCQDENSEKLKGLIKIDSTIFQQGKKVKKTNKLLIKYHLISVKKNKEWLKSLTLNDTLKALLLLNRVDKKHLLRQDTLIIPDTILANHSLYSHFPDSIDVLKPVNKIIFISYYLQAFVVYENGIRIRWGAASLGKKSTPTSTGLHFTNWKSKKTTSTVNSNWVMEWYFNIDNFEGVSMHQYALPGYPASHACIRLFKEDAFWIYNWADQWVLLNDFTIAAYGTPVIVYGSYPFADKKPWLMLSADSMAIRNSSQEIYIEINKFLPLILKRQIQRDSVLLMNM